MMMMCMYLCRLEVGPMLSLRTMLVDRKSYRERRL